MRTGLGVAPTRVLVNTYLLMVPTYPVPPTDPVAPGPSPHTSRRGASLAVMHPVLVVVGIVVALAIAALAVHFLLVWMDRRGWVWYRNPHRVRPTSLGLLEEIYQPSIEHATELAIEDETLADQAESGEPDGQSEDPSSPASGP